MPDLDVPRVVRDIANLRMQVNALEVTARNESLPTSMKETRSTMRWSAAVIAVALVLSSAVKFCGDSQVQRLEKRVEVLEKYHAASPAP